MKIKSFAATSRIVDREKDIAQIIDLFHHAECTQVHIVSVSYTHLTLPTT